MRSLLIILFITGCLVGAHAQEKNYKFYHLNINKAEEQAFVKEDIKGALQTYLATFQQYDFVFAHDCMTAIQLALYDSNAKAFLAFVDKGTKNGLMPRHMMTLPYIKKHPLFSKYDDSVAAIFKRNRPIYLARIDTPALKKMYSLFAFDQMEKNPMKGEGWGGETDRRYKPQIEKTWAELKQLILEKGWPSDRLIGIGQGDIMKELRTGTPDMMELYKKYKDGYNYTISAGQFQIDEYELHSTFFFPIMAHFGSYFHFNFFPDEFYIQQIEAGYLHPKDIAYVLDFDIIANRDSASIAYRKLNTQYFGTAASGRPKPVAPETYIVPDERYPNQIEKINAARAKFYIKPLETEIAKDRFRHRHKMYMGWGYSACRL